MWTIPLTRSRVVVLDHDQPRVAGGDAAPQRGLDALGDVDGDHRRDRRHHLARLLLVEVEDAAEHPRLAGVEGAAELGAVDDLLQVLGGVALFDVGRVDAEEADDRVGDRRSAPSSPGPSPARNQLSGRETRRAVALGVGDRQHLRHLLADADVERGDEGEGDRHARAPTAAPWERPPKTGSSSFASEGSPRKPIPIEAIVIPTWQAESDSSILSSCSTTASAPASPSSASCSILPRRLRTSANSAATKKPLIATSSEQQDQQQDAHRLFGPVLRGRSSSAIRRREYSFLESMRIASLVPSATEMLFALGLGEGVVAVTHECDYPPEARSISRT